MHVIALLVSRRGIIVRAALVVTMLVGCTMERSIDIASITIDGDACDRCATDVSIDRTGRVRTYAASPLEGTIDARYGDPLARFPYDEFVAARERPDVFGPARIVMLDVRFRDGAWQRAPVTIGPVRSTRTGELASWTSSAAFEADDALLGHRRRAVDGAVRAHALRRIVLEELGCYGSCARYAATFEADGRATMRQSCDGSVRDAHALVTFARVLDAAESLQWLRPAYPIAAVDTQGARITTVTHTETFASYGPDRMAWDVPFSVAERRLDQLVRDLSWRPRVRYACPRAKSTIVRPRTARPRVPSKNGSVDMRIRVRRDSFRSSRMAAAAARLAT